MSRYTKTTLVNPGREAALCALLSRYAKEDGFLVFENNLDPGGASWIFLEPVERLTPYELSDAIWSEVAALLERARSEDYRELPVVAGYLGYELMHSLENVAGADRDEIGCPVSALYRYRTVLKIPAQNEEPLEIYQDTEGCALWEAHSLIQTLLTAEELSLPVLSQSATLQSLEAALAPYSNFSRARYRQAVLAIQDLIAQGEVYQVNLSQQFSMPFFEDPRELFKILRRSNPVRYGAFLNLCDESAGDLAIVSGSPELFLSCKDGVLLSSPIKGTRARGETLAQDELLKQELRSSLKDNSELAMIVDLIRNDLGRVSALGSVQVLAHARLESYATVHHLVSDVSSRLAPGEIALDALKALFPCGSVTGAPKIAAMKYISQLEGCTRGVYTGAFGYFSADGGAQLNVAIRTATVKNHKLNFNSGGGVIYDSDPDCEYEETLTKAQGIFLAAELCKKQRREEPNVANL